MSTDGRRAFLERLVDDAGLFPPANLPMADALAAHAANRAGPWAWMLGRFLCPASRLEELVAELPESLTSIRLGVILDRASASGADDFGDALEGDIEGTATVAATDDRLTIDAIEVRLPDTHTGTAAAVLDAIDDSGLRDAVTPYLEAPFSTGPVTLMATVDAVAVVRASHTGDRPVSTPPGAKVRCGGTSVDLFPAPDALAAFIDRAVRESVPFKATAGLHHPVRVPDPETGAMMHGFLNLVGATALAVTGAADMTLLRDIIEETEPNAFALHKGGFQWREVAAAPQAIHESRLVAFHAYGSCSFDEPVGGLTRLGVLP